MLSECLELLLQLLDAAGELAQGGQDECVEALLAVYPFLGREVLYGLEARELFGLESVVPLERAGDFPGSDLVPDRLVVVVHLALPVFTW